MLIRKMTIDDYDGVYALWLATPGLGLNDIDDSRAGIEKYLLRNPGTCFVAETNGALSGVIMSGHDGRRAFIYHMAVAAQERSRGIGCKLLAASLAALAAEGITKAALVVFAKNQTGNDFWANRGFANRDDLTYRNKTLNPANKLRTVSEKDAL